MREVIIDTEATGLEVNEGHRRKGQRASPCRPRRIRAGRDGDVPSSVCTGTVSSIALHFLFNKRPVAARGT